jgi:hypothetical protein
MQISRNIGNIVGVEDAVFAMRCSRELPRNW